MALDTSIQYLKGVGPVLGSIFQRREIETIKDLLYFFPRTYQSRLEGQTVSQLQEGTTVTVSVTVTGQRVIPIRSTGKSIFEVRCRDQTETLTLKWFNAPVGMRKRFTPGTPLTVTGKVKLFQGRPEMVHPEISWGATPKTQTAQGASLTPEEKTGEEKPGDEKTGPSEGETIPVYTEIEGVSSRTLRKLVWESLEKYGTHLQEDLPRPLLEKRNLLPLPEAIRALHFPPEDTRFTLESLSQANTPAHRRLIYGEFFKFEYLILRQKLSVEEARSPKLELEGGKALLRLMSKKLPFQLTQGQIQAIKEAITDLAQPYPMNRLVQGDVGSGKTLVAFLTAAFVLGGGGQAALMAPTEILAEQHFRNACRFFGSDLQVAILSGKTSASEREHLQQKLKAGEPLLVIGTHALLEDPIVFSRLAYIMIDEQHRFGVEQRRTLRQKGAKHDPQSGKRILPHSLILTATPIPRTLALTAFGDLSVSTIRELPPGRSPVITRVVREPAQKLRVYEKVKQELSAGRQAYFIYPLVNESEAEGFTELKSAVAEATRLAQEIFPEYSVGLLHGKLSSEEKEAVMDRFKKGDLHILVSTTVIEVGVDVPNATLIVIEHSERFGLSQLHQLRGRVGRGNFQSYCFLFSGKRGNGLSPSGERLDVLEKTSDGFEIAEADLEIRGPGEFLGTRQAGGLPFRLGDLVRDRELLLQARDDALEILRQDPELRHPAHQNLRRYYEREGGVEFERLKTS